MKNPSKRRKAPLIRQNGDTMKLYRIASFFFAALLVAMTAVGCASAAPGGSGTDAPATNAPADTDGIIVIPDAVYENMTVIDDAFAE